MLNHQDANTDNEGGYSELFVAVDGLQVTTMLLHWIRRRDRASIFANLLGRYTINRIN